MEEIVTVEVSDDLYHQLSDLQYTAYEMLVYGNKIDYLVYAETAEEATTRARSKFAELIALVAKSERVINQAYLDEGY